MRETGRKERKRVFCRQKNVRGRQLARVNAVDYRETVWSQVYAGNRHANKCLPFAVVGAQSSLELAETERKRTVWRFDGGGGSDSNLSLLLAKGYHIHAKGYSANRAAAWARAIKRWDAHQNIWLGELPASFHPTQWGHPVRVFVIRRTKSAKRAKKGKKASETAQFSYGYLVSTLQLPSKRLYLHHYNERGGAEVAQFREDKSGLALAVRRKRSFQGQQGLILLTDLAHNLLADFHHRGLSGSCFDSYGLKRIVRDLLCVPGKLTFDEDGKLVSVQLLSLKQISADLTECLKKYQLSHSERQK